MTLNTAEGFRTFFVFIKMRRHVPIYIIIAIYNIQNPVYTNRCRRRRRRRRCCTPIRSQVVPFQKNCKICRIRGIGFVNLLSCPARTHTRTYCTYSGFLFNLTRSPTRCSGHKHNVRDIYIYIDVFILYI